MHQQVKQEKPTGVEMMEEIENTRGHNMPVGDDDVHWWKQRGLRQLYLLMPFLFLGSTTLGYDGSLLNGLQAMPTWKQCEYMQRASAKYNTLTLSVFHDPSGSLLGLYGAMPGFGGLVVLLFAPYVADYLGRRNGTGERTNVYMTYTI